MDPTRPSPLLGGLTPAQFMRRHWQKKPLLVRQAVPLDAPPVSRSALFDLAAREDVESRLIRHGADGWTLLVQGVDLHHDAAHDLLRRFRFLPDARLDDLMISYAGDGGGVGAHFDSYDVFLLQVQGTRRWSIGRQRDLSLQPDVPLKILREFVPEQTFDLAPGDMLYLPPRYAHDGVAIGGDCMTYSIGLRAPASAPLGADLLARIAEAGADALQDDDAPPPVHYRDPGQDPVATPAAIPAALQGFARQAVEAALRDADAIDRALGESMTEPKANVWFEQGDAPGSALAQVRLDRRTRMLYDERHIYINGESFRAGGRDAALMRRLADLRMLDSGDLRRVSSDALALIGDWCEAGWVHGE